MEHKDLLPQSPAFSLATPITGVRSVGARSASRLAKLGIRTVRQLLWHLPARYEDYSQAVPIADVEPGQKQSIQGEIVSIATRNIWPKRMTVTTATIRDESGAIRAVWFNQPYLEGSLTEGTLVSVAGKIVLDKRGLYVSSPIYEKIAPFQTSDTGTLRHTGRLIPIYPETEGVTSKYLRFLIQPLLENLSFEDPLPDAIRRRYDLTDLCDALKTVHYPESEEAVPAARERLAFDDILVLQLTALRERRLMNRLKSIRIPMDTEFMRSCITKLPFGLTKDQRVAVLEVLRDMERPYPMNRLLEGDVGSGKTVVALLSALHAAHAGSQTVVLAPTEVLALQHYRTLCAILGDTKAVGTVLLTGAVAQLNGRDATKISVKRAIASGAAHIIIGTHAVINDDVRFDTLALVVIDEQHRFGIEQRATLVRSSRHASGAVPHLLSMTATPIPRTLALTIFGDLDISIIREKPSGRKPIQTRVVSASGRAQVYEFIREQVQEGRQVFVICPAIEQAAPIAPGSVQAARQGKLSALWAQVKAVEDEYARLKKDVFPDLKIAMLHGRMKAAQKQSAMKEFKDGWHDILVSTSVIEVGVDIPNASIMVVEGADRFGLAQLHQFRGRVGRAEHQSYCFLFSTDETIGNRRLKAMEQTDDGFNLAEMDMKIRGPGEFFGIKQSGMPDLTMAALANVELIKKARTAARAIMKIDPDLKRNPLLAQLVKDMRAFSHLE